MPNLALPYVIDDPGIQGNFDTIALTASSNVIGPLHVVGAAGEPAFQNAWVNFGGGEPVASFYKDRGRVYLTGSVKTGTVALVPIFTLPAGYLPPAASAALRFPVVDGTGLPAGVITILANGNVCCTAGNNALVALAPVDFRAS